jgi:hypothetical protein
MKTKIIAYYSIFIGISVIAMWIMILSTETPPEGKTELSFHLFSEFLMANMCLVSGILLLRKNSISRRLNILGLGMVVYSVLNAAGYYGERNEISMMIMFIVLLIITSAALILQMSIPPDKLHNQFHQSR